MGFPKKIKKDIDLTPSRTLYPRRLELLDKINEHGTFLPKSILHADLDKGFLDFVKNDLKIVSEGKVVPVIDVLITTQNWAQFTSTWDFQDLDKNINLPFVAVVRQPEIKYGSHPSLIYTIPNRKQFYYASVPSYDGNKLNVDVYKIPQPVPVDIIYNVKIICNRMRELNQFNKSVLQKFTSRQAYTQIKGHYIPIIWNNITDDSSVMEVEKRKFYIQNYEFTLVGFLIDEDEFEVSPGVQRVLNLFEVPQKTTRKKIAQTPGNSNIIHYTLDFIDEQTISQYKFYDNVKVEVSVTENITSYDVFINEEYYGINIFDIILKSGDVIKFQINKEFPNLSSKIVLTSQIS
jgi:hypothetical protein